MRNQKSLVGVLRGLADLLTDESRRNPEFAARLENVLGHQRAPIASRTVLPPRVVPDVYAERNSRDESEFRLWLRDLPMPTLRAIISAHDLDATRRTSKWKDASKIAGFIADQLATRSARGASFLRSNASDEP